MNSKESKTLAVLCEICLFQPDPNNLKKLFDFIRKISETSDKFLSERQYSLFLTLDQIIKEHLSKWSNSETTFGFEILMYFD